MPMYTYACYECACRKYLVWITVSGLFSQKLTVASSGYYETQDVIRNMYERRIFFLIYDWNHAHEYLLLYNIDRVIIFHQAFIISQFIAS